MVVGKPLVFVHLSDIHFNKKWCDHYDLDQDIRDQLEKDVVGMRKRLGDADGILITGDVAFRGKKDDYDVAVALLKAMCALARFKEQRGLCISGHHSGD